MDVDSVMGEGAGSVYRRCACEGAGSGCRQCAG